MKDHHGKYFTLKNAQLYTLPEEPPPGLLSGFGEKAIQLAARIGDGYCGVEPEPDVAGLFRSSGGGDKPAHAGTKVCFMEDEEAARKTAHRLWANEQLPGELAPRCRRRSTSSRPLRWLPRRWSPKP